MIRLWRWLLPCLLVLGALGALAQAYDDDSQEDASGEAPASLWLNFDRRGAVHATFTLPDGVTTSDTLANVLGQALHCPAGAITRGKETPLPQFTNNWSAAKRERYRKQMAAYSQRWMSGKCDGVLARNEAVLQGDFDYSPVIAELQQLGVDQLGVYVNIPPAQFHDYTKAHLVRQPVSEKTQLVYEIPVGENATPVVLHLAYGFRRADLYRSLGILAGFIVLPVAVTLWMRRKALASAKVDAAGAWFGFFRSLSWLINGAMLLWITSGFGARQGLQDWVAGRGFSTWEAVAADIAVVLGPALLIYFLCGVLSYSVHAQLRGRQWTRREFLSRQMLMLGARVVPLMLGLAGVGMIGEQPELAVGLLVLAMVMLQVLYVLRMRVIKEMPQALTTGELRDRVFALAGRLGVSVQQIFVLPAGKGQVANAYAAGSRIVMFTDYLLEHLSKREVDAVAAHELAHLRYKHPGKRGMALMAAILLPFYFRFLSSLLTGLITTPLMLVKPGLSGARWGLHVTRALSAFAEWPQRDFVLIMVGLTGFYFLSRHFENVADATAVRLTNDPEAQITGLLKLNRLNFIPIQWGKASESWLTHPSTMRRAQRIAAAGGMAPEKLQEILVRYNGEASGRDGTMPVAAAEDHYAIPTVSDPEKMRTALRERNRTQAKMWAQMMTFVLPPALFAWAIERAQLTGYVSVAAYAAGMVATVVIVNLASVWLGEAGKAGEKKRLRQRLERAHMPVGREGDIVVGFAPGPFPRLFGAKYHWDSGFLVLAKDRLQFVGEQVRFSLAAAEIDGIVVSRGGPSWWKFERVYVRWKTADGRDGIFNLNSLESGSIWHPCDRVRELGRRLEHWHEHAGEYPEVRAELAGVRGLEIGQVTSVSPQIMGKLAVNIRVLMMLLPIAAGVGILTHTGIWYLCVSVAAAWLIQAVPYWRYRDVAPVFPNNAGDASRAREARSAGDMQRVAFPT